MHSPGRETWRQKAAPVVAAVLETHRHAEHREVRRAIRAAYPFGKRRGWAYQEWLAEVRRQLAKARIPWRKPGAPREQLRLFKVL